MTFDTYQPFLPPELILSVFDWIVPPSNTAVALPPSHISTKTFLSLARTSSIIYPAARRLLYTHCLWIDSIQRLQGALASIRTHPFVLHHRRRPEVPILEHINSLYLSYDQVSNSSAALLVLDFFTLIAPHLRRLVIDIPLRTFDSHYDWDQHRHARLTLGKAFLQLTAIETFCSTRDELWLPTFKLESPWDALSILPAWPRLKTVALYNLDVSAANFWQAMGKLKNLETAVFTRCDGLEHSDLKAEWRKACGDEQRPLDIVLVNVESQHRLPLGMAGWKEDEISVRQLNVPISYYGDEDARELCQEWVKRRMLRGENPMVWD